MLDLRAKLKGKPRPGGTPCVGLKILPDEGKENYPSPDIHGLGIGADAIINRSRETGVFGSYRGSPLFGEQGFTVNT